MKTTYGLTFLFHNYSQIALKNIDDIGSFNYTHNNLCKGWWVNILDIAEIGDKIKFTIIELKYLGKDSFYSLKFCLPKNLKV